MVERVRGYVWSDRCDHRMLAQSAAHHTIRGGGVHYRRLLLHLVDVVRQSSCHAGPLRDQHLCWHLSILTIAATCSHNLPPPTLVIRRHPFLYFAATQAQRQALRAGITHAFQAVHHGLHVVRYLAHIIDGLASKGGILEAQ